MFMGELSHAPSLKPRHIRLGHDRRFRLVLSVLTAAALAASILATTGTGVSLAGESEGDTIALVDSQGHFTVLSSVSEDATTRRYTFGEPGDVPLMGDWNCDGDETPGVYRLSTGGVYLRNSHSGGNADISFLFGNPGDRAIAGDFDGDGCDTVSVYRSHRATAFVRNLIASGDADMFFLFGNRGDRSFVGDFNDDGVDTIGLHRNSTGTVYLANENRTSNAVAVAYGNPNDQILAGDWNGNGSDTVAAYRPSTGMFYFRNSNSTGSGDGSLFVGRGLTVVPVAGIDSDSIGGDAFDPGSPEPVAPVPAPPAPAPSTPAPSGDVGPVAGFDAPPARQESGPIDISGESNVVIENLHISNPEGACVDVSGSSNVTIRNSTIGPCGGDAIYLTDVDTASISGNYITDTNNGVLIHRSYSIVVDENAFINAGRNFVQFDKVNGAGSSISGNRGQNELGGSNAEDMINLYQSNGTASSPIRIVGNYLRNGGPSDYGSGIMLGDSGGSHQFVEGNVMVNPGQVGIGVASGDDISVIDNLIYSASQPWSNVGVYVWNQYGSACSDIEVSGNQVNWTAAGGYSNAYWEGGGCSNLSVTNNDWHAPIGPGIF
jgi:hypothetical protein